MAIRANDKKLLRIARIVFDKAHREHIFLKSLYLEKKEVIDWREFAYFINR